jgi:glycosyltransferase involved in cell wall biosynthesis
MPAAASTVRTDTDVTGRPLVSVVTPVYNGARFLEECIESVLAQSYENWEYVILDNASSDETADIVARYAAADERITVHTNDTTLPLIENWNRSMGLISERSEFCRVLHADDWIYPTSLEKMVDVAMRHPSVTVVGSLRLRGDVVESEGLPPDREFFSGREWGRLYLGQNVFTLAPTSSLLRADIVRARDPFYSSQYLHADLAVFFEILSGRDVGFVHEVLSFSRVHEGSITSNVAAPRKTLLREWLFFLDRYGPLYFEPGELQRVKQDYLERYYRMIVRGAVTLRGRDFVAYHLQALRDAGRAPTPWQLGAAMMREVVGAIARPDKVFRHVRRRNLIH